MDDPMDIDDVSDVDSSFYGDSDTVKSLQKRVDNFDAVAYLKTPPTAPRAMRERNIKLEPCSSSVDSKDVAARTPAAPPKTNLHNPYDGVPYAWQLSESVDNFLKRLPPSTTDASPELPWIYICNPYVDLQGRSGALPRGCENEGPQRPGTQVALFVEGANERLRMFESFCTKAQSSSSSGTSSGRTGAALLSSQVVYAITKERNEAVADISDLARNLGVTCGKWMLFPEPSEVDEVWAVVARATAKGALGIAAKVAPRPNNGLVDPDKTDRLICVYTADFGDVKDVGRVLVELKDLGLVKFGKTSRPLYYKTDAYTYLGIASGNKWEIKASLYSSPQVFKMIKNR